GGASPIAPMFQPVFLRGLTLDYRVLVSPMCQYSSPVCMPADWIDADDGARSVGGLALIITEWTEVVPIPPPPPGAVRLLDLTARELPLPHAKDPKRPVRRLARQPPVLSARGSPPHARRLARREADLGAHLGARLGGRWAHRRRRGRGRARLRRCGLRPHRRV